MGLTRRTLLAASAAAAARPATGQTAVEIVARSETIEVDGKAAKVGALAGPSGRHGVVADAGARFRGTLRNALEVETLVHWQGQTPPQGLSGEAQAPLGPGRSAAFDFPLRPGTHWMHSRFGLQRQTLLSAPLVVREDPRADVQDVVVMLNDFTFKAPDEILAHLASRGPHAGTGGAAVVPRDLAPAGGASRREHALPGGHGGTVHLNEFDFDAYLANRRTLADPEIVRVSPGQRVRLRIVDAAAASAFWIDLGQLQGAAAVATDGNPIRPHPGRRFPLAVGQRLDIELTVPARQGAWPVLAQREGDRARTGIVLATAQGPIARLPATAEADAPALDLATERRLVAASPLPERAADRSVVLPLGLAGVGYVWTLSGQVQGQNAPLEVRRGERVELTFANHSPMAHPMHLHGHIFQVVAIDGRRFPGPLRDTVILPAGAASVTVAFDAGNPGRWPLHCLNLYHWAAGMATELVYV